ncbi:MAG: hypothetical protein ACI4Q6_05150, partial [Huintestinicola sp.]
RISSDFNDRTAEKMIALRDSMEQRAKIRKTPAKRIFPAVITAAACLALASAAVLNTAGTQLSTKNSSDMAIAPEMAAEENSYGYAMEDDAVCDEAFIEETCAETSESTCEEEVPAEESIADEPQETPVADAVQSIETAGTEAQAETEAVTETAAQDNGEAAPQLNAAQYVPPVADSYAIVTTGTFGDVSEEVVEEDSEEVEAGDGMDSSGDNISEDAAASSRTGSTVFSPSAILASFDRESAYMVLTPLFEEYDPESGTLLSFDPAEISDSKLVSELIELFAYYNGEGREKTVLTDPLIRYTADISDGQGNALRVIIGSGFIGFSQNGQEYAVYPSVMLSDDESAKLEERLFALVKQHQ